MLMKSGLLLLLVTVLQVSGRYKNVEPDFIENVIQRESGSRIVSGWEAQPGQHPHHAALRIVSPIGGVSGCGGSIVSKEWVITAAHCTAGRVTVVVRGGVVSLTNPEYIFESTEFYNHPQYNSNQPLVVQPHDISLVKVPRPFVYSRLLKAIRIQSSADAYRNYDGEQVYASGHGRTWTDGSVTEVLRWVYLRAIANESCRSTFVSGIIIETSICARFYNVTSQSTCQGDSGGPLVHVSSEGVPTLVGVTSFVAGGSFGCHSGLPAGFIRPGPYLSWFQKVTGIDFENLQEDDDDSVEVTTTTPEEDDSVEVTTTTPEEDDSVDVTTTTPEEDDSVDVTTTTPEDDDSVDVTTTTPEDDDSVDVTTTTPEEDDSVDVTTTTPEEDDSVDVTTTTPEDDDSVDVTTTTPEDDDSVDVTTTTPEEDDSVDVTTTTPEEDDSVGITTAKPEVTTTPPKDSEEDSSESTTPAPEDSEEDKPKPEDSEEDKPEPEDTEEEDSDSSDSNDDEMSQLLKRLEVKVKVKVKVNKYVKKQVEKEKEKQIRKRHHH